MDRYCAHLFHSASAVLDDKQQTVLVDHTEGFATYTLQSGQRLATYVTGETLSGLPCGAAFGEHGQVVITGGRQGKVYIFDSMGGSPVGVLQHSRGGRVQSISVRIMGVRYYP
jgi:hypothetical protein